MFAAFARSGRRFSLAGTLILGLIGGGCSPLRLFNAAMPKDAGSLRAISGVQFMDGQRGELDLYVPRSPPGTGAAPGAPVIVFFYGGSWNSGARQGYGFVGRALAARGFLVAIPDYRLVPQVRYPAFLEDNAAAIRWLRVHARAYGGDPDRLILAGHSAGAYNAAMLAMDPRWLGADRAAVKGLIGLAGPYDFLPFAGKIVAEAFGAVQDHDRDATQPVCHVAPGAPPAFLASGDQDNIVLPRNSDALAARLRQAGVAVERKRYAGIGHVGLVVAIAQPFRGKAPVLDDMAAFAHRVASGDSAALPSDAILPAPLQTDCAGVR